MAIIASPVHHLPTQHKKIKNSHTLTPRPAPQQEEEGSRNFFKKQKKEKMAALRVKSLLSRRQ
jgi:hypothetical protein